MIVLIFALVGALLFSYLGWWYESRFRKKIVKGIKEDIQREIGWIELNHYEDVKRKEYETFKKALEIVDQYDFD